MNENQRKWLLDLQSRGIEFENASVDGKIWHKGTWEFKNDRKDYRIPAQSIPDIPDWQEYCRELQSKGVEFEFNWDGWEKRQWIFKDNIDQYRIPEQPIPEWKEEMIEETKPDPREETPHRELQIQWHEDKLHHLRTGEPMREWQFRHVLSNGDVSEWRRIDWPEWRRRDVEYRRKPRTVTYWHCVGVYIGYQDNGVVDREVFSSDCSASDVQSQIDTCKENYPSAKFGPIIETTVELED